MKIEGFQGRLRLRFTYQGVRKCLSLGLPDTATNRRKVEAVVLWIESDIERGCLDVSLNKYRVKGEQRQPKTSTFKQISQEWLKANRGDADKRTIQWYQGAFKRIDDLEIDEINYSDVLTALKDLRSTTARRYLTIYKSCWEWSLEQRLIDRVDNPFKGISLGKKKKAERPEPFSAREIRLILDGFNEFYPEYNSFISFLLETGCRLGEALGLKWQDLNKELTVITIKRQLTRGEVKLPKNNKIRRYKLSLTTTALLTTLSKDKLYVFHDGSWDDRGIYKRWRRVLLEKQIKYRKPYNTRHTFVSHCLEMGSNLYEIAQVTGHDPTVLLSNYAGMLSEPEAPVIKY